MVIEVESVDFHVSSPANELLSATVTGLRLVKTDSEMCITKTVQPTPQLQTPPRSRSSSLYSTDKDDPTRPRASARDLGTVETKDVSDEVSGSFVANSTAVMVQTIDVHLLRGRGVDSVTVEVLPNNDLIIRHVPAASASRVDESDCRYGKFGVTAAIHASKLVAVLSVSVHS